MGFSIGFLDKNDVVYEDKEKFLHGAIVLGSIEERFLVPLSHWRAADYERHWSEAILRILSGEKSSCLITSMYNPSSANFIVWWPMYRIDDQIFVQNQILFLDRVIGGFDENKPFQHVGTRQIVNEDSIKISEWSVELTEVSSFEECWKNKRNAAS